MANDHHAERQPDSETQPEFLILFYWSDPPPELNAETRQRLDREFAYWAEALEQRGEMVIVRDVAAGEPVEPPHLDRMCVIRARDRSAALEHAQRSPHLEHGGSIAVHPIRHP